MFLVFGDFPGERVGLDRLSFCGGGQPGRDHRSASEPFGVGQQLPGDLLDQLGLDSLAEVVALVSSLLGRQVPAHGEVLARHGWRQSEQRLRCRCVASVREPGQQAAQRAVQRRGAAGLIGGVDRSGDDSAQVKQGRVCGGRSDWQPAPQ
ncbi:MAG: hypothetical protein ACRDTC_02035 [Pseudonocardiaceae bacterium]